MVYQYRSKYFVAGNSQIAPIISNDNVVSKTQPFAGMIKFLINPPLKTESSFADFSIQLQITESFLKSQKRYQFRISSNTHLHRPRHQNNDA